MWKGTGAVTAGSGDDSGPRLPVHDDVPMADCDSGEELTGLAGRNLSCFAM